MLYINGQWMTSGGKLDVINPATGKVIETVTTGGKAETEEAVASATKGFRAWKNTPGPERGKYLEEVVQLMRDDAEEIAKIITSENGKPLADARNEVRSGIDYLEWYSEEARRIYGDTLTPSDNNKHLMVLKEPVGVSAAITPWNFPFSMITRKIAPALAAGCTIVLKPASATPLSAIKVFEYFDQVNLPKGVVNLVIGSASEIGQVLTDSVDVRKLTFTGSTFIGKKLLEQSADTVKKVSLELGGHAPYVVFEDADIDLAVDGAINTKFRNAGQTCISTNRIYVQKSIAKEFGKKLAERTKELNVGDGMKDGTDVGPLIDESAIDTMNKHVQDAIKNKGEVLVGGKPIEGKGEGYFYEPTVIQFANDKMIITTEETFGPIAPIFTFESEEEIIEKSNHKYYGLAAYCFTENLGRGLRMMRELEYGIVGINDPAPIVIQAPFGGIKQSGIGNEGGKYGIEEYLEDKYVSIRMNQDD